jgi:uroporphyrinogen decarboxylase
MTSKERVRAALTRERMPDRVPLQFDLSKGLGERFARKYGIPARYTPAHYADVTYRISANELRVAMGSDCVVVGMGLPHGFRPRVSEDGLTFDEFGMGMRQGPLYMDVIHYPLAAARSMGDVEAYQFPDPVALGRYDDAEEHIGKYGNEYFIVGDVEVTLWGLMQQLVGLEKLLMDAAVGEPYVEALLEKCERFAIAAGLKLISLGVDGIWLGDDFGTQKGMIMSPKMWRRLVKESYRRVYAAFKAANPRVLIMQHCDGAVAPILGDWIEVGLEVFNPVQPNVPGHDPAELKNRFGRSLSFWGAIDQQQLLPFGTPAEIAADVREKIRILGEGGGYMVSPAHIIQEDTPLENVEALIEAVREYGAV